MPPMTASCHCGSISITAPHFPSWINDCQCGVCYRYGAAWGYYTVDDVTVNHKEGSSTRKYVWGDSDLEFHFCENCGGMVYWWPILGKEGVTKQMGINTKMVDPELLKRIERRAMFDAGWGEGSWR